MNVSSQVFLTVKLKDIDLISRHSSSANNLWNQTKSFILELLFNLFQTAVSSYSFFLIKITN